MKIYSKAILLCLFFCVNSAFSQAPGTLDLSFYNQGYRIDTLGDRDDRYNKILRLPDGKFLVCGASTPASGLYPRLRIHKIDADANLDGSFNQITNGLFPVSGGGSECFALTLNASNQILATGTNWYNSPFISVARINPDGNLDETFSPGGASAGSVSSNFQSVYDIDYGPPTPSDIKTGTDGSVFICGEFQSVNLNHVDGTGPRGWVVKYTNLGVSDSSFGTNGAYKFDVSLILNPLHPYGDYQSSADQIEILDDGKILVLGSFEDTETFNISGFLARLNSNGTPDQTFGTNGVLNITNCNISSNRTPERMLIEENGSITIVGSEWVELICRVLPNGEFDASFGNNGFLSNIIQGSGPLVMFEKTENGKYILGSSSFVQRLNSDLTNDYTFRLATNQAAALPQTNRFNSGTITNNGSILMVGNMLSAFPQLMNSTIVRINNSECDITSIEQPSDVYGNLNTPVTITITVTDAIKYTWQKKIFTSYCLTGPSYWLTINDPAVYTGTATAQLTISNLTQALDSSIYRCVIQTTTCGGITDEIALHIGEVPSITQKIIGNRITAYPNPARESIRISSDSNQELNETYQIIDLNGKIVQTGRITGISQDINLTILAKGLYRIHLENGGGLNFIRE